MGAGPPPSFRVFLQKPPVFEASNNKEQTNLCYARHILPVSGLKSLEVSVMQRSSPAKSLHRTFRLSVLMFFLLLCAHAFAQEQDDNLTNGFYLQRSYPSGHIPIHALRDARERLARHRDLSQLSLPNASWRLIGPQPTTPRDLAYRGSPAVSGRVTAIAVDSSNSKRVFLGAAEGGVWNTTDGGNTWTPLTDSQVTLATGSVAIDQTNPQTIYVGTGEQDYLNSYYGAGVLKSTDGGKTWAQLGDSAFVGPFSASAGGAFIGSMVVDPSTGNLFAGVLENGASGSGVYRSTDGGNTWNVVLSGAAGNAVVYDPNSGNLFAALGPCGSVCGSSGTLQAGVFVSTNHGTTWSSLNNATLPKTNVGRIGLAISPATNPSTLYAGIADSATGSLQGVWKTTNGGTTWTQLTLLSDYCTPQCWFDNVVAVSPTNANVVYLAGKAGVYQSLDGGTTWTGDVSSSANGVSLHSDTHAMTFSADGSVLYVGDDGGVWSGTVPDTTAVSWTNLNNPLAITQFYKGFSINPSSVTTAVGGTQDNGTQLYSGSLGWDQVICGDGGATAINPANPNNVFAVCITNAGPLVYESTAGGAVRTFVRADSGVTSSDRAFFGETLVIDPSNPQTMYFGSYRVYQTTNGAQSWALISPDLTNGGYVSALAVAPGSNSSNGSISQVVYATTSDGNVWVTQNAASGTGAKWTKVNTGLPNRWASEVFPTSSSTAYVTFLGFSGFTDNLGHVFMTTNTGQSWTDVSGNLPNIPVNDIVVDPQSPSLIYIATDVGILGTTDGGTTWATLGAGLPNVAAVGLRIHAGSRILRTATHGRSMWDMQLQDFGLALSPSSATVTAGQPANSTISITPNSSGFTTPITLSCSGLPAGATCNFATNPVTPGSSPVQVTLSIPTTASQVSSASTAAIFQHPYRTDDRQGTGFVTVNFRAHISRAREFGFVLGLPLALVCFCLLDEVFKRKLTASTWLILLAIGLVLLGLQSACGSSSSTTISQNQPPAFTSANSATFTVGAAGSLSVTTTGTPTPTVTESGSLPTGVTFTANASGGGVLSGTPTVAGTYKISFTATNSAGSATQTFTLTTSSASNMYTVVITGTSGGLQHTASLQLTLQ